MRHTKPNARNQAHCLPLLAGIRHFTTTSHLCAEKHRHVVQQVCSLRDRALPPLQRHAMLVATRFNHMCLAASTVSDGLPFAESALCLPGQPHKRQSASWHHPAYAG